jgi:HD-GYP domain-containing protein (c-di-GMP phosphodiesterase class II)
MARQTNSSESLRHLQSDTALQELAEASQIIHAHHECDDGTGYPRGLKKEQILLGSRIVTIANTLDSITSDLPYRPAQSLRAAREEIQTWSGRQFDPEIVKVFLEMPDKTWEDLRREIEGQALKKS